MAIARTGTDASAAANNWVLLKGEMGYTLDGHVLKIGDGVTHWNDLTAIGGGATLTTEQVQDIVGAMVTGNTETGITVDYQDADGTLDFAVTGGYTDESIQDLVGAMVSGNTETNITVTYDDTAGKLNFVATGGTPTAAQVFGITEPKLVPPGSPNAKDDEFDGTSSATWSNTPSAPATASVNSDIPGALHLAVTTTGAAFGGRVQAVPVSYPFTVTTRMSMATSQANYQTAGIIVGPAAPTGASGIVAFGTRATNQAARWTGTFAGSFSSETNLNLGPNALPLYFRIIFNSATSLDLEWSKDGYVWIRHQTALNPGFTPGVVGLAVNDEGSSTRGCKAIFDFFRVT